MRWSGVLLVAWFASVLVPGIGEIVEDAVHLAVDAHSADHADGEEACPEHGCTPTAHHCSCCMSLSIVATMIEDLVPEARASGDRTEWLLPVSPRAGFARDILRPPTA